MTWAFTFMETIMMNKNHQRLLKLLQSVSRVRTVEATKPLHALTITNGPTNPTLIPPIFINNNLIYLYASLNALPTALKVFDKMPHRSTVSYNSVISSCCKHDLFDEAVLYFHEMVSSGFRPNEFTVSSLLSCASMGVGGGVQLHSLVVKNGLLDGAAFVGTALLGLFGSRGLLDEAVLVFEDMPVKSLVTWNSMVSLFGRCGFVDDCVFFFRELTRVEKFLSESSFVGVLSGLGCECDQQWKEQVHGFAVKNGFDHRISVVNALINVYVSCGNMRAAEKLFEAVSGGDVVTWNTIIHALASSDKPRRALACFQQMLCVNGIVPNNTTYTSLISACTNLKSSICGESVHARIVKTSFETDVYVGSALVDYYAKCNKLDDAHLCFLDIAERNVVSWNALISGYVNKGSSTCFSLLLEMLQFGCQPNESSFSAILKLSSIVELRQLHSLIVKMGYVNNEYVLSSLISSYGHHGLVSDALIFVTTVETQETTFLSNNLAGNYNRSGRFLEALRLLSKVQEPDTVSWNIVIVACARNGNYKEVFDLFKHMLLACVCPDNYTYVSLIAVCTKLTALALGGSVHAFLIKTNFSRCDTFVCNALIDMYGKCGNLDSSVKIFESMTERNLITWTALISALALNGNAHEALERFKEMEFHGFKPDKVAFTAVLVACRHGGLVREAMELFEKMQFYGVQPEMDHYRHLVDLLATSGYLNEAENIISSTPYPPDALVWRSFVEGCRRHRSMENEAMGT